MQFDWNGVANKPPFIAVRYLEEALTCLEREAFRMSVVASACALNYGLHFVLRLRGLARATERVMSLAEVIEEIKRHVSSHSSTALAEIPLDKCERVMYFRNAFAHPEEYLILNPSSRRNAYTLKPKFGTVKDKEETFLASQFDKKKKLKAIAEESLDVAYNTIKEALTKSNQP